MTDIHSNPRPPLALDSLVGQCVWAAIDDLNSDGVTDRWIESITRTILLTAATHLVAHKHCSGESLTYQDAIAHLVQEAN